MMRRTPVEQAFNVLNVVALVALIVVIVVPLLSVVSTSFVSNQEIARRSVIIFPDTPDLTAYKIIFRRGGLLFDAYKITFFRVIVGTAVNMTFTYLVGYALSRRDLPGRTALTLFFFFTMMFSGGLIPYYIVVKSLGLINSIWVYVLPGIISVWNMLLMRNFIMNIPVSLTDAAEIDGASQPTVIARIVLPLSVPALVTIALFYAVGHWNSWWDAYLFVSAPKKQPMQLFLRNVLAQVLVSISSITQQVNASEQQPPPRSVQNAVVVVSTVPIVIVYPFLQKYFIKGIMIGSIKG
jgi:putative aldouronate transport system permease protein